jgi:hypothetical protein
MFSERQQQDGLSTPFHEHISKNANSETSSQVRLGRLMVFGRLSRRNGKYYIGRACVRSQIVNILNKFVKIKRNIRTIERCTDRKKFAIFGHK